PLPRFCTHPTSVPFYALSLHDALPICPYRVKTRARRQVSAQYRKWLGRPSYTVAMGTDRTRKPWASASRRNAVSKSYRASRGRTDRKSTRLNSSHVSISYAVFRVKKKT